LYSAIKSEDTEGSPGFMDVSEQHKSGKFLTTYKHTNNFMPLQETNTKDFVTLTYTIGPV